MGQHGERPYAWLLIPPRQPVRRQAALPGCGERLPRVRGARPLQRPGAGPRHGAIEAYGKGGFSQLVLDGKHEFVERYNFASPYWKTRTRADNPRVVQELKTNLKDVATYFHASAQKSKRVADYQEAARWYRDYLKSFPEDADAAATDYLLAEALFESHQYDDAAAEYEHTAYAIAERQVIDRRLCGAGLLSERRGG